MAQNGDYWKKKMAQNGEYWKKRMEALEKAANKDAERYYKDIQEQFRRAANDIQMDIERWYYRIADNNEVSYSAAKKLLKKNELEEFHWTVEQYIKAGEENAIDQRWIKQLENSSAKVHISRLEAMKTSIQQHAELLYSRYENGTTEYLRNRYKDSYYQTAFEIMKGTGIGVDLHAIDTRKIDTVLTKPWAADEATFDDRIWKDKSRLINTLHTELSQHIIRGESVDKMIANMSKTMNVSRNQAGRLIMTESAAISSAAAKECYRDLDVEKFEVLATLDFRTSEICRQMDGKITPMSDYKIGVTAPPFHPFCRSTTVPYFDDEFTAGEKRAARGEDGKTYYVPANINYSTWSERYIKNSPSAGKKEFNKMPIHDSPIKLGEVDFLDKNMVLSKLVEYEKTIFDSPIENAIVITKEGNIYQCFGDLNGVYPNIDLGESLSGAVVTHNHPIGSVNEYSFSDNDIDLFIDNKLEMLRGIDERYIYELTRNPEQVDDHITLEELMETDGDFARHEDVIDIAKKHKIGYRRWDRWTK